MTNEGIRLNWTLAIVAAGVLITVGGMQWQILDNSEEIEVHVDEPAHREVERELAVVKTTQEDIKENLTKIEAHTQAQTLLLNQVVTELALMNERE